MRIRTPILKLQNCVKQTNKTDLSVTYYIDCEKQKITLRLENSPRLENAIFWHANFHSGLESQLAEDAIKLIDNYYDSNIEEILGILKNLIGEPKETWKHSTQKT